MKYKIYDKQLDRYMFGNGIFGNKSKAINKLISYLSISYFGDLTKIRKKLWNNNKFAEVYLEVIK